MDTRPCYAIVIVKVQSFTNDGKTQIEAVTSAAGGVKPTILIPNSSIRELIFSDTPPSMVMERQR
jgi:hypothetical protein